MRRNITSAVTGMAVGMLAGTAAYMMSGRNTVNFSARKLRKGAEKALKNAGTIIENVSDMMR
jgi:hypothetical protein